MAKGTHTIQRFDSMGEALAFAQGESAMAESERSSRKVERGRDPWSGIGSWAKAVALAETGWSDLRDSIDAQASMLASQVAQTVDLAFVSHRDVSGVEVDVAAYVEGEPECMVEYVLAPMPKAGKVVKVLLSGSYVCGTRTDQVIRRGAALLAMVAVLAKMGVGVEVWTEATVRPLQRTDGSRLSTAVRVKASDQALDLDAIAFASAHPAMFRRIIFSCWERLDAATRSRYGVPGGYGLPCEVAMADDLGADLVLNTPNMGERYDVEWIIERLRSLGVDLAT